jgi:predicted dehydrogenase
MSARQNLRVALVGAGAAGQAHAFGYRNVSMAAGLESVRVDLAVVVDPNVGLAQRTADRYGYTTATGDLTSVLDDPSIDAISVALPNSVHAEVLPAILRSGKHVLTEKPIGRNATEAAALVALAEQSPAVTGVGFSFRRLPGLAAVHHLVAADTIGAVHSFTAWYNADYGADPAAPFSWRYAKATAGAGALIDIGTHAIDAVQYVIAPIRRVISATLRTEITERPIPGSTAPGTVDTDDIALLTVELTNGAVGQIHVNRIAAGIPNSLGLQVHGASGHARFDSIAAGEFHVHADTAGPLAGPRRVFTGPAHPYFSDVAAMPGGGVGTGYAEAFVAEVQQFVRCIQAGTAMDTSFPSALRVMQVVDAAQQSAHDATPVAIDTLVNA